MKKKVSNYILRLAVIIFVILSLFITSSCSSDKKELGSAAAESIQIKESDFNNETGETTQAGNVKQVQQGDNADSIEENNTGDNDVNSVKDNKDSSKSLVEPPAKVEQKVSSDAGVKENGSKSKDDNSVKVEESKTNGVTVEEKNDTVSIKIVGPQDIGIILPATDVVIEDGDTVMDVLIKATKEKKIQMEYKGTKTLAYIEGIDNVYEFDYGNKSGWIYRVNGEVIGKSCGVYAVNAGDSIEWLYSLDMGKEFSTDNAGGE